MVARKPDAEGALSSWPARAFRAWHDLLDRLAVRGVDTLRPLFDLLRTRIRHTLTRMGPSAPVTAGALCLLAGGLGRMLFAPAGPPRSLAIIGALATILWAGVRLGLLVALLRKTAHPSMTVAGAWGWGLIAYAIALDAPLALAAWTASAVITAVALDRGGVSSAASRRAVAMTWGAQAAATVASWVARNLWVVLLARG